MRSLQRPLPGGVLNPGDLINRLDGDFSADAEIGDRFDRFHPFIGSISDEMRTRAMSAWPGPVTWLFPKADDAPAWLTGEHDTIAVRLIAHRVSRELCEAFGGAIVSTSANPSAAAPARTARQVLDYFRHDLAGVVEGEPGGAERPSEIRDLSTGRVLREG